MNNWNLQEFRNHLSMFLNLITVKYEVPGDFSKLWDLLGKLNESVKYDLEPITFNINGNISGTVPSKLNRHKIYFENAISIKENCDSTKDNILNYKFELHMDSYYSNENSDNKLYKCSWHHDKHDVDEETKYTHPSYHFHFGGRYLKGLDTGEISMYASPRIPHPPMDIFLGIHFIICNFFSSKEYLFVNELINNITYQRIISKAQDRLWVPYFSAYDSQKTHDDFTIKNVFPLYIN